MRMLVFLFIMGCAGGSIKLGDSGMEVITGTREECAVGIVVPEGAVVVEAEDCYINEEYERVCSDTLFVVDGTLVMVPRVMQFCDIYMM